MEQPLVSNGFTKKSVSLATTGYRKSVFYAARAEIL
jgi:hypothetical protein